MLSVADRNVVMRRIPVFLVAVIVNLKYVPRILTSWIHINTNTAS